MIRRVALAVACLTAPLAAQDAVVRGRVVRSDDGTPVSAAEVRIRQTGPTTTTDTAGRFELRGAPTGPVELEARRLGFKPTIISLALAAGEARTIEVQLTATIITLDPITTTATREPRSLANVAAAVTVADTLAIQRGRTVGLDETLRMMPGVQAASRFGTEDVNIGIRGSSSRSRQAVRGVAVLLDGVPLTEPDGVGRLDLIELAAARQIEVVRGPISALYAGSASGVLNVISRSGFDSPGATLEAHAGSYGFEKYVATAGGALANGKGGGYLAGSYTQADNYRAHSEGNVARGLVRGDYRPAARTTISFDAQGSVLDTKLPGSLTQAQTDADPNAAQPAALFFDFGRADTRYRMGARLAQGLDATGEVEASGYFYYGGRTLDFPIPGQVVDLNFHRTQVGARIRAAEVGGAALDLAAGVDYDNVFGTDQRWTNSGGGDHGPRLDDGTDAAAGLGVYLQGEWEASRAVAFTLGLRYDAVTFNFTSAFPGKIPSQERILDQWSPKLTTSWRAGAQSLLYASIAHGFEVPAFGELSPGPGAPVNAQLQPKTLWNYELGARGSIGTKVLYDASVFYADVTGEFVPRTVGGLSVPENASSSRNIGLELAATVLATSWLDLSATYTYSDFRLLDFTSSVLLPDSTRQEVVYDGNLLPGVPQHRLTAEAVTRPLRALTLGLRFEWQSLVYVENGNQQEGVIYVPSTQPPGTTPVPFRSVPARALVQLNGQYQAGPVGIFATVENLFGTRYTANVVGNSDLGAYYEAGPGTWVSLGVRLSAWPKGF